MAVLKDTGSVYKGKFWRVCCYYKDWRGELVRHEKRGFATRREAVEYEHMFLAKQTKDINMAFNAFVDIYLRDVTPQLKKSTIANKIQIIDKHIRPYFINYSLSEITSTHILIIATLFLHIPKQKRRASIRMLKIPMIYS